MKHDGRRAHCKAALVVKDWILTNAHCVVDPYTHQLAVSLTFIPNVIDGVASSPTARAVVTKGSANK